MFLYTCICTYVCLSLPHRYIVSFLLNMKNINYTTFILGSDKAALLNLMFTLYLIYLNSADIIIYNYSSFNLLLRLLVVFLFHRMSIGRLEEYGRFLCRKWILLDILYLTRTMIFFSSSMKNYSLSVFFVRREALHFSVSRLKRLFPWFTIIDFRFLHSLRILLILRIGFPFGSSTSSIYQAYYPTFSFVTSAFLFLRWTFPDTRSMFFESLLPILHDVRPILFLNETNK